MSKGTNRQARLARQATADKRDRRNRRIRSAVSLIAAVILSALFYHFGILHELEPRLGQLEARLQEKAGTSDVALVVINDDDYLNLFQSKSPLAPGPLQSLLNTIAAGRPKLIGVDIDTSDPQFKALAIPEWWPPVVWHRGVKENPGADLKNDRLRPADVLGRDDVSVRNTAGLTLLIDTEGNVTRRYQRLIDTTEGALPSFPWAIASRVNESLSRTVNPSNEQLVIRYSAGTHRFRFTASRVLELSQGAGWATHSPIEGRVVLLGGSFGATDRHETPLGSMVGVEILANVLETELDGGGHRPPGTFVLILLLIVEGVCPVLIFHKFESQLIKPLLLSLLVMTLVSLVASLLIYHSIVQLPYFLLLFFLMLVYQGYEALSHRAIVGAYEDVTEQSHNAGKRTN